MVLYTTDTDDENTRNGTQLPIEEIRLEGFCQEDTDSDPHFNRWNANRSICHHLHFPLDFRLNETDWSAAFRNRKKLKSTSNGLSMIDPPYEEAAARIRTAEKVIAFTGAGISEESGIPTFSREDGLWVRYDPICIEINNFMSAPRESWESIREIFYDALSCASPGLAHYALAEMEINGYLSAVITQNIDNLHQEAGTSAIHEFHGTARILKCMGCTRRYPISETDL